MEHDLSWRKDAVVRGKPVAIAADQALAVKIVNIAGITSGTRVVCLGENIASMLAMTAAAAGARVWAAAHAEIAQAGSKAPPRQADVLLFRADASNPGLVVDACRRWLGEGGRIVAWTVPANTNDACRIRAGIARLVQRPVFTSTIVGLLPPKDGGAVIATGIFAEGIMVRP